MLLTGYAPSAEAVSAIGKIAAELRYSSTHKALPSSSRNNDSSLAASPGAFFWALDPVMGDLGVGLYVDKAIVPVYQSLVGQADLIMPNQFEIELLSGEKVGDLEGVRRAVERLHLAGGVGADSHDGVCHVVVTSVHLGDDVNGTGTGAGEENAADMLTVVGSTRRSDGSARLFRIDVPALPCYFSGTGDMFAALLLIRLREACLAANLLEVKSWQSPDDVPARELPLAKAVEKVLSSMHLILEKTMKARNEEMRVWEEAETMRNGVGEHGSEEEALDALEKRRHLAKSKAAEIRLVRNVRDLLEPENRFKAVEL